MGSLSRRPGEHPGRTGIFNELDHLEAPDRSFIGHRDIITRSLARYTFIRPSVRGEILDVGCGRGYGFDVIAPASTRQVGVDISREFLRSAKAGYPHIPVLQASGERLPFRDRAFDTVISFEVIEHLEDDQGFLGELQRLVRPGGRVLISTPNRLIASGDRATPLNPFHTREYTVEEFTALLSRVFRRFAVYGQLERVGDTNPSNRLVDWIPIRWKYLIPSHMQGMLSILLRPPLRIEDCTFLPDRFDQAHTLLAVCEV